MCRERPVERPLRSLRATAQTLRAVEDLAADAAHDVQLLVLVQRLLQALQHLRLLQFEQVDLGADLLQVVLLVEHPRLALLLCHELRELVVEEPGLLQVSLLLADQLRLVVVDGDVAQTLLLGGLLQRLARFLFSQALLLEDKHLLVGDLELARLRFVLLLPKKAVLDRELLLPLALGLNLELYLVELGCFDERAALELVASLLDLLLVLLLLFS